MTKLAMLGGSPIRENPFPAYRTIGAEEKAAVADVLDSGVLSRFQGAWHEAFYGGPKVREFEAQWAALCDVKHAVAVNSCTSGLYAAVGAAGVEPGDEVIVSPYTMSASATAAIAFNAVPVFADIDPQTYCISAETIAPKITDRTRVIMVVHIFGQCADMDPIMELARQHDLVVIEDAAQAPLARYKDRSAGSLGHMGVFSLNYHKHIHSGEGGVITTNDDRFAERTQLIRNHAEAVVGSKGTTDLANMVGFNYRMGEIEAAIALCQMAKALDLIARRKANVAFLENRLADVAGLTMPHVGAAGDHVYYVHTIDYDKTATGIPRSLFVKALKAELPSMELRESEGSLVSEGYVRPLYMMPMYQELRAFGTKGFPFVGGDRDAAPDYSPGLCPHTERAHHERVILHELMHAAMTEDDMSTVADAFEKVVENLPTLRDLNAQETSA